MATNFVGVGESITWTNGTGSAVSAGDVVVIGGTDDAMLGIAHDDIAISGVGPVYIEGVFNVVKVTGAVIAQGESVTWDASAGNFDDNQATPATGDVSDGARAVEAAGSGVLVVAVKLTPGSGTITA